MTAAFDIAFPRGTSARAVEVERPEELDAFARALTRGGTSASIVVIGGAEGLAAGDERRLSPLFRDVLAELAFRFRAAVLDGGTDVGVMRLMGNGRRESGRDFPLVGVAPAALVAVPGRTAPAGTARLEPNHTHFVLVPGERWGDEGPWLERLGTLIGGGTRSATVLVNGGDVARREAERSVAAGRPVVVLAGSGRTADELADAAAGRPCDEASARIASSGLVRPVDADDRDTLAWMLDDVLSGRA